MSRPMNMFAGAVAALADAGWPTVAFHLPVLAYRVGSSGRLHIDGACDLLREADRVRVAADPATTPDAVWCPLCAASGASRTRLRVDVIELADALEAFAARPDAAGTVDRALHQVSCVVDRCAAAVRSPVLFGTVDALHRHAVGQLAELERAAAERRLPVCGSADR